jgi:hypothetical protein
MARFRTMQQAITRFNQEVEKVKNRSLQGLIKVQSVIHQDMDATVPKIPVDTGNMRKSYFCATSKGAIIAGKNPSFTNENKDVDQLIADHKSLLNYARSVAEIKGVDGAYIVLGFSAHYAKYVHELYGKSPSGKSINWTREGSGPGFFAAAISRNIPIIKPTTAKELKVGK